MFSHIDAIGELFATVGTKELLWSRVLGGHMPVHGLSVIGLHAANQTLEHLLVKHTTGHLDSLDVPLGPVSGVRVQDDLICKTKDTDDQGSNMTWRKQVLAAK